MALTMALPNRSTSPRSGNRVAQNCKFVTAKPRNDIVILHQCQQPFGDLLKQLISGLMAEGIIHSLEAIEIKIENSEAATGPLKLQRSLIEEVLE